MAAVRTRGVDIERVVPWAAVGGALLMTLVAASRYVGDSSRLAVVAVGAIATYLILIRGLVVRRDWFHPLVFPVVYFAISLFVPLLYLVILNQPLSSLRPTAVTTTLVAVFSASLGGLILGAVGGLRVKVLRETPRERALDYHRLRWTARLSLLAALPPRGYSVITKIGQPYGQGQFDFGITKTLDNVAVALFLVGVILSVLANVRLSGRLAGRWELLLAGAFVVITLASGSRGELIAPALFVVWAQHRWVRPIRLRHAVALLAAVVLLFQGVAGVRKDQPFWDGAAAAAERTLIAVGVPLQVTSAVIRAVPDSYAFRQGSTYVAAVKRQLPSPVANRLFGNPDDTGSFVVREVTGFSDPNQGQGFALPAEGYLNFGLPGALLSALLVGALLGVAYRQQASIASRWQHLLYPVVLTALPYGLRADALAQIKQVLYPLALLGAALWLCRREARSLRAPPIVRRLSTPVAAREPSGSALGAIVAGALLIPAGILMHSFLRAPLLSADAATRVVVQTTGVPLVENTPTLANSGIDRSFNGGDNVERLVVVVCYSEEAATRMSGTAQAESTQLSIIREANVVVFYAHDRRSPDRSRSLKEQLAVAAEI